MILYFADRGFNVLGLAGDKIKRGYNIVNDEEEIDVENGVATFSFDIFYSDETRSDIEKLVYVGNYVLRKDGNEFKAYTIIDTDQSTENRTINVRAEDMGLDLINDIALPFNYETADYEKNVDHAAEGNAANKGYINENGAYVADNNYRATNHMGLGTTPPEAWLFRVTKSEVGSKRYSVAFYNSSKTFIPGSGKYYYLSDSEQISRIETPAGAKYVRISFHKDITSAYFVASSVKSYPITTYVENCVGNSGFEIGLNEIGDVRLPLEFDDTQTCSERLNEVVSSFGAELGFSFEFKNLVISKKMVNLYTHRGADNRVELRMGRDVKNIRISRSVADLATAIIAIGKTVDGNGDEALFTLDGYSGTIESGYYIEGNKLCSQKAYSKWSRYLSASGKRSGHIVKNFEYECGSQQSLYEYALADLKAIEDASVTYEVELFTLPSYVGLGDTVYVVDDLGEIYISARVLSIRRSEINDTISVELGEFVTKTSGLVDEWSIFRQRFAAWSAANAPRYVWVAYANDNQGTGISIDPTGKNWMGIADNQKSQNVDLSDPTIFNWIQLTAKDGKDGAGVLSTTVTYAVSNGPNVMPGDSDWQNTLPSVEKGKCLWTRTVTDYTDDTIPDTITYTYAIQGADGQNGQPGQNGVSVEVSSIEYVSWPTEQTPPDNASWSTTIPTVLPGDFLWTRTTFSDGKKAYGKARQGEDGKDGESPEVVVSKSGDTVTITVANADGSTYTKTVKDGTNGTPGTPGADGKPSYIHIAWANSADGTVDFSTSVSTGKQYLGTYSDQTQADSTDPTKYSWSLIKGADGKDGKDGTSVTVTSTAYAYQLSTSGTTVPTGTWQTTPQAPTTTQFAWTRTTTTFSDGKTAITYTVGGKTGQDGKRGAEWYTGTGITGTSTTATIFSGSGVSSAVVGDMYLNTSTYNTYRCTVAGNASTAKWVYVNNIKGLKGDPGTNGTNGTNGDDGRGVSSIDREYYLSTSNTTQSGGSWSTTPAAYVSGRYYWSRDKIVWTNPAGTTYTTAVLDNGLNSANATAASAQSTANTANSTANIAKTTADNAASAAATAQATADAASVEYIVGTQTSATGIWTGVTRDSELVAGKTIAYKLPYAGSGNASLNLTLSGGGTTGSKAVYLNTTRVTTHFGAGAVIQMTYNGTDWRITSIPNTDTNYFDRRLHNNYIKPLEAVAAGKIICGTSSGYKAIAANVQFDIGYPILLAVSALAANTQNTAYEAYPSVNMTTTGAVEGLAVDKTVWLKVQYLGGSQFAVAAENFLTCTVPTESTAYYYIPLGLVSHDSTAKTFFVSSDRLYGFVNGEFQPLDTAAVLDSRSLRTEFMTYSSTNDGIVAGIRSDLSTVENNTTELANDISSTKQLVESVRSELATITKDDTGYLALVTQRIDALTNRVEKAEGYMTAEGWVVEDSNNQNTKTIMTGDGLKVTSNEAGNDSIYLDVNSVNSTIHNTTITGYANIAGFSLVKKEETEYDGTSTLGLAFNS